MRYRVRWALFLPRLELADPPCMTTRLTWWRRLARQLTPRRSPARRGCCDFHAIDMRAVGGAAIRYLRQAQRQAAAGEDLGAIADHALDLAAADGWDQQAQEMIHSLYFDPIDIGVGSGDPWWQRMYFGGRHRTYAQLEAGAHRVLTAEWPPAP